MADIELYLTEGDAARLRKLLRDYEAGNLFPHDPRPVPGPRKPPIETMFGKVVTAALPPLDPASNVPGKGRVQVFKLDVTSVTPALVSNGLPPVDAYNASAAGFPVGAWVTLTREPFSGAYLAGPPAGTALVRITDTVLTDGAYFAGQVVFLVDSATLVASTPPFDVWLFIIGPNLVGPPPWVPAVGDVYLAVAECVRPADGLPVYAAVGLPTDLHCPQIPGVKVSDLAFTPTPDFVVGYKDGCLVKIGVGTC